jgi:hypothetical protein
MHPHAPNLQLPGGVLRCKTKVPFRHPLLKTFWPVVFRSAFLLDAFPGVKA